MNLQQNKLISRISGLSACAAVAAATAFFVSVIVKPSMLVLVLVGVGVFFAMYLLDNANSRSGANADQGHKNSRFLLSLIPVLFYGVWIFFMDTFGYFNWGATLFHLAAGAGVPGVAGSYLIHGFGTILAVGVLIWALLALKKRGAINRHLDIALALAAIFANPMIVGPVKATAFPSPYRDILATYFVDAKPLVQQKISGVPKSVLHILLESAERTYFNEPVFGDVMAPLAPFERRGFTAHNMMEVTNTNHSIGGAVAANCGLPFQNDAFVGSGTLKEFKTFLPRLTCLGDVLEPHGYEMSYFSGWPADFLGQGVFYKTHGFDEVYGSDEIAEIAPGPGEIFGVADDQVLDAAYAKLEHLHEKQKPYVVTIGLSGGHAPDGFSADVCSGKTGVGADQPRILDAVKCTNMLVADFINNAEKAGMLDNTIVVIQSDHLAHESTVSDDLAKFERRNLFIMYGPGIEQQKHDAPSASFDIYPTVLQALGFDLEAGRAGVGTSLLSGEKSLVEIEGYDKTNSIITDDQVLRRQIWRPESVSDLPSS